jgi:flagellar biosynthesis protein FlhG
MSTSTGVSGQKRKNHLIPVASGKGGVGKSVLTANLGVALASMGLSVVLVDLDLGGSNLHSMVGVENSQVGIGGYAHRGASRLEDILAATPYDNLRLIAGDSLLPGAANIPWWFKKKLLSELVGLSADITLIDLGAGSSYNTIDFFLASREGLIITTPEPTAMVNGYSFLKNAYYRLLFRLFPSRTPERALIRDWAYENRGRGEGTAIEVLDALEQEFPGAGQKARSLVDAMKFQLVMNDFQDETEEQSWRNLASAAEKNLGMTLSLLGSVPNDSDVRQSAFTRIPSVVSAPDGPFGKAVSRMAAELAERV